MGRPRLHSDALAGMGRTAGAAVSSRRRRPTAANGPAAAKRPSVNGRVSFELFVTLVAFGGANADLHGTAPSVVKWPGGRVRTGIRRTFAFSCGAVRHPPLSVSHSYRRPTPGSVHPPLRRPRDPR